MTSISSQLALPAAGPAFPYLKAGPLLLAVTNDAQCDACSCVVARGDGGTWAIAAGREYWALRKAMTPSQIAASILKPKVLLGSAGPASGSVDATSSTAGSSFGFSASPYHRPVFKQGASRAIYTEALAGIYTTPCNAWSAVGSFSAKKTRLYQASGAVNLDTADPSYSVYAATATAEQGGVMRLVVAIPLNITRGDFVRNLATHVEQYDKAPMKNKADAAAAEVAALLGDAVPLEVYPSFMLFQDELLGGVPSRLCLEMPAQSVRSAATGMPLPFQNGLYSAGVPVARHPDHAEVLQDFSLLGGRSEAGLSLFGVTATVNSTENQALSAYSTSGFRVASTPIPEDGVNVTPIVSTDHNDGTAVYCGPLVAATRHFGGRHLSHLLGPIAGAAIFDAHSFDGTASFAMPESLPEGDSFTAWLAAYSSVLQSGPVRGSAVGLDSQGLPISQVALDGLAAGVSLNGQTAATTVDMNCTRGPDPRVLSTAFSLAMEGNLSLPTLLSIHPGLGLSLE